MAAQLTIGPEMLRWALSRSDKTAETLPKPIGSYLNDWLTGVKGPTIGQLEKFAKATHTPFGYFFLDSPPDIKLPIADFRQGANKKHQPSVDLIETIESCQRRQDWYRDYLIEIEEDRLPYVGSLDVCSSVVDAAKSISRVIGFSLSERKRKAGDNFNTLMNSAENAGILVMVNSIVGNNTKRSLDYNEFRGFSLADEYAPLIFINGSDYKAAQLFTLAHELAHIWLGESGISDASEDGISSKRKTEKWCNSVAAELLVPQSVLEDEFSHESSVEAEKDRFKKILGVSGAVVLRRFYDVDLISKEEFEKSFQKEVAFYREMEKVKKDRQKNSSGGPSFHKVLPKRVSHTFAKAVISSAAVGRTSFRQACALVGVKGPTLKSYGRKEGVWK